MPKSVDHEARREQIAHAACGVVARRGFDKATVAHIARAAGFTTGMLPPLTAQVAEPQDINALVSNTRGWLVAAGVAMLVGLAATVIR